MRFVVEKADGLAALQRVASIVNRKHTVPVLANVAITAESLGVHVRASDLDMESTVFIEAAVAEPGETTAKADIVLDILRNAADGADVEFKLADGEPRMTVKTGRSRFQVATIPVTDFPHFGKNAWESSLTFPADRLAELLGGVAYAMSPADARYILKAAHLHMQEGALRAVATDGHIMAYRDAFDTSVVDREPPPICIPAMAVAHLQRILADQGKDDVTLSINPQRLGLYYGRDSFVTKLLDGQYPDYRRVLPREFAGEFTVGREALTAAIRRVMVMGTDKARSIKFTLAGGLLTLSTHNAEGEATDEVEARGDGELVIGFNGGYALETLASLPGETVTCRYVDRAGPTVWSSPGAPGASVLMPQRI